ncbi:MAG: PilZ domain-containing protein [Gammaproteobacteria bacterium SHHR-1]|uniref:PilZ domain-containing protein n=1 Tax=Magnetovirga frankeli TaxID=947516 RepID=UPI001AF819ED|nr:PilZ domain-containing protein [gamma proteobacterium SS-5]
MTEERRRFHRIHFDAPANLTLESSQIQSLILDCSLHGVMVKRHPDWQPRAGEQVGLQMPLTEEDGPAIQMQTEVMRISADSVGLSCQHIDLDSITRLRRLVELNLGDSSLLERDLEHLVEA